MIDTVAGTELPATAPRSFSKPLGSATLMSEDNRCERCRGEIKDLAYRLRLDMDGESEPLLAMTVCDYCRKSFDGWVARRKRTGSGRSSSASSKERPDLSSQRSSSSRSGSSNHSNASHGLKTDGLLETAKSGFSSMIEAAKAGMIDYPDEESAQVTNLPDRETKANRKSRKKRRREEREDDDDYDDDDELSAEELKSMGLDSTGGVLITIGVVIGVFIAIGLVLYYLTKG